MYRTKKNKQMKTYKAKGFYKDINGILTMAFGDIQSRFENGAYPEDYLSYHNTSHTTNVCIRAKKIAEAMSLNKHEIKLVIIAAAFHDIIQDWEELSLESGCITKRARYTGHNETASAFEAVKNMKSSSIPFSPIDFGLVTSAILATIPGWDQKHLTVIQPMMNQHSDPVVRAVALADLSSPGMDPNCFVKEGVQLFFEENLDITDALLYKEVKLIHPDTFKRWHARLVTWLKSQKGFACGRRALLRHELRGLSLNQKKGVLDLFCHFDESIEKATDIVRQAESMNFIDFMKMFRRDLPPILFK